MGARPVTPPERGKGKGAVALDLLKKIKPQDVAIGGSGAFGAFLAVLADVVQKEEASATIKITRTIQENMRLDFTPLYTTALVIVCATILCFIFKAQSSRNSFFIGLSMLSIVMTITPYKTPPGLASAGHRHAPFSSSEDFVLIPKSYKVLGEVIWASDSRPILVQNRFIPVKISLNTGKSIGIWSLSVYRANGTLIGMSKFRWRTVEVALPVEALIFKVEAEGFRVLRKEISPSEIERGSIFLELKESKIPLPLQRFTG